MSFLFRLYEEVLLRREKNSTQMEHMKSSKKKVKKQKTLILQYKTVAQTLCKTTGHPKRDHEP